MLYRSAYKAGLSKDESELLRKLRGRGFAVAIFNPSEVGSPLNRGQIENQMVRAGTETIQEIRGHNANAG